MPYGILAPLRGPGRRRHGPPDADPGLNVSSHLEALRHAGFRGELESDAPLAPHTTWRIGGPAELLAVPLDSGDLELAVGWAVQRDLPWRVLGNGSNLLVRDTPVKGLVIRLRRVLNDVRAADNEIVAGAGASFPAVARYAARRGLSGIEFGAGIPGTIGGAIVMNAGWHEFEIGAVVESVRFLNVDGETREYLRTECAFGYHISAFRRRPGVVLCARMVLEPGDPTEVRAVMDGYAESRKANQPTELPSCGSVFLKPPGDFAGRLIEQAGLKGRRVGGVEVSQKHANFFVNTGGGSATDALTLVELVEQEVERKFGVRLVREFELW